LNLIHGKVKPGTAFIAQRGLHADGHLFIDAAIENGAVAVFCEEFPVALPENVTFIKVGRYIS
jgi:UDP-N-acetylmuramoyl-L-alanyl-D-glutamate--2,6-diaminopimelate ligase